MFESYLSQIFKTYKRGDAREESYYHILKNLIDDYSDSVHKKYPVTVLPKNTEAGNPDFRVWDGKYSVVGYIEAKDFGKNLDDIEDSEQLTRYRKTFPNVILTNFTEFRLYRDSHLIAKVSIARPFVAQKLKTIPPLENTDELLKLFERFFAFSLPKITTAKALALELAKRTRFLRDEVVAIEMEEEGKEGRKAILGFFEAFKKYLIGTLSEKQFADLYAQTITYGLFAARTRSDEDFNRELAFKYIPQTIGILRDVFRFISLEDPPQSLSVIVDDISEVLHVTDVKKILHDYFADGKGKDPIIHFYETFLAAYDPETRERRGVYYTPEAVVSYIVRAIHSILKTHFDLSDGFASPEITVLDPAAGTLTFPAEAIKLAVKEFVDKYGEGGKKKFIKTHILPRFFAFELMMAPYAIGHLKISFLLEELGYKMDANERFNLYLTNTLEMEDLSQTEIQGLGSLSEESHLAGKVKKEQPILVIMGNPPYSGMSSNPSELKVLIRKGSSFIKGYYWNALKNTLDRQKAIASNDITKKQKTFIGDVLMDYYFVDGNPLGEKNPKWLQDDYVKFLRFAQWKIEKAGFGIVGMITNHSYLDNPTFRGMRQSLMKTFNEMYILDLHGNSLKKETKPDGGKDENVFDIKQGVAIVLLIKQKGKTTNFVRHFDRYGLREKKYEWLEKNEFNKNKYKVIYPESPYHFLIKRNTKKIKQFLSWKKINEIFPVNNVGIVTARDNLTIKWSKQEMWNTILNFSSLEPELARQTYSLGKDVRDWKVDFAQKDLKNSGPDKSKICPILYRPFDVRYTYYTGKSRGFLCMPRSKVMHHMLEENIALITVRRVPPNNHPAYFMLTNNIISNGVIRNDNMSIDTIFPLYIYPDEEKKNSEKHSTIMMVFEPAKAYGKRPNISSIIFNELETAFSKKPSPEEIFYYIYGIFYSKIYRETYSEFLKIDFPRVPFTSNYKLFKNISKLGQNLAILHLLKSSTLNKPIAKYQGSGENDRVEFVKYEPTPKGNTGRIYINKEKYFDGITEEVWNYYIGGYQVCHKWLKDRKSRYLTLEEVETYCKIVTALSHTIKIQKQIDEIYPEVEKDLIKFD